MITDNQVIALIKDGKQSELGIVYEKFRTEFLHWISKEFHCDEDDCKDIYQLSILILYENIRSGKLEHLVSSVKTYLFGIGKNVARETLRRSSRHVPIDQERWLVSHLSDDDEMPRDEHLFTVARDALDTLGDPCRRLLQMVYYERSSMEEISAALHYKNADTAKNQKCKCMARLRTLIERKLRPETMTHL